MTKKELRLICRDLRYSLTEDQRLDYNKQIRRILMKHLESGQHVAIFLPITKFHEIDLLPLLDCDHIHWYAPKSFFSERRLEFLPVNKASRFEASEKGIPEPEGNNFIDPQILDVVVLPMLISDESGYRVGYGKGFYDNFLKRCKPECKRIGVNYFTPVEKISDVDIHDEPIHFCVCPEII